MCKTPSHSPPQKEQTIPLSSSLSTSIHTHARKGTVTTLNVRHVSSSTHTHTQLTISGWASYPIVPNNDHQPRCHLIKVAKVVTLSSTQMVLVTNYSPEFVGQTKSDNGSSCTRSKFINRTESNNCSNTRRRLVDPTEIENCSSTRRICISNWNRELFLTHIVARNNCKQQTFLRRAQLSL